MRAGFIPENSVANFDYREDYSTDQTNDGRGDAISRKRISKRRPSFMNVMPSNAEIFDRLMIKWMLKANLHTTMMEEILLMQTTSIALIFYAL